MNVTWHGWRKWALWVCLLSTAGCRGPLGEGLLLPARWQGLEDTAGLTLVARIVHVSDTHVVDEESPARFAGAQVITRSAWRPWEAYATQIFDGIVRATNRIHAWDRPIDFVVHTGDACDNVQSNELAWFLTVWDGGAIDPLTGPDDRPIDERPAVGLDPHAMFDAQGLYQAGVHGDAPSIPWYVVFGNHDVYGIGVFPILSTLFGERVAPLPLDLRPGILLPTVLDPTGAWAHGNVTPAYPGPPPLLELAGYVTPSADRAYYERRTFIRAMFETVTGPAGHGFADPESGPSWYSTSPVEGVRLIGLNTCDQPNIIAGLFYQEAGISAEQVAFLRAELDAARERGEWVIVASHHPSPSLSRLYGSVLDGEQFRAILGEYPNVILHLAGHEHRNHVMDRGSYLEIETCATIDLPQEARVIEIRQDDVDGSIVIAYEMFSHLDDALPSLGDDPLHDLRAEGRAIAEADRRSVDREKSYPAAGADPGEARGTPFDRQGAIVLP